MKPPPVHATWPIARRLAVSRGYSRTGALMG